MPSGELAHLLGGTPKHIVQLGNRDNTERQNAQILSSFGIDAPSYKQYQGINSYSLVGTEKTVISPEGNRFEGVMKLEAGTVGWDNIIGLPEEFQSLSTGAVNLLRNTGFTGDYESKELTPETQLNSDTPLFSNNLKFWDGEANINEDSDSESGFSATLIDTTLSQTISPLIQDENYIISFRGKGQTVTVQCGDFSQTVNLTDNYARHILPFNPISGNTFSITGRGTVCEIQLERGKIVSGWSPSPLDNNKALEAVEAIRYISDAVKNGSTSILGGLILSSMIQLGNYVDGTLKKVTAIMSGIYNDDRDVAFAAGGDLQKAIYTAMNPHSTDVNKYINFLVTHGGLLVANEAIIRGTIYATDGEFSGAVYAREGEFNGKVTSNSDGDKIIIDPVRRAIVLKDKEGVENTYWGFSDEEDRYSRIRFERTAFDEESDVITAEFDTLGILLANSTHTCLLSQRTLELKSKDEATRFLIDLTPIDGKLKIIMKNLPTTSELLSDGQLWLNDGKLDIYISPSTI